jgi:sigma-B regulation protein RsbU (phosphoserine phosphatase)
VFTASRCELDAFTPEHLRLLQGLCNHVSVAVHNARRFQHERQALQKINGEAQEARTIQQALLPRSSPLIPGFQLTGSSLPAGEVGGDWFDFIPLENGRWGLVLADVSGKGIPAALLMSATRGMLRSMASTCDSPSVILERLNKLLIADFPAGKFVTLIYGVLDPVARTLTFSSAGHLQPLRIGEQDACFMDSERGIPLGIGTADFSERVVELPRGTRLVFYSDGITEATGADEEEYGPQRLLAHARQPHASVQSILDDVRKFANGAGLHDDATVIVVNA